MTEEERYWDERRRAAAYADEAVARLDGFTRGFVRAAIVGAGCGVLGALMLGALFSSAPPAHHTSLTGDQYVACLQQDDKCDPDDKTKP